MIKTFYFVDFQDALDFMKTTESGRVKPMDGYYEWQGEVHYMAHYRVMSVFVNMCNFKRYSNEEEINILNSLGMLMRDEYGTLPDPYGSGENVRGLLGRIWKINNKLNVGQWRLPRLSELESDLMLTHGVYWISDDPKADSQDCATGFYFSGYAYDAESKTKITVSYSDSKHINGTCRFEGGGYSLTPKVLLVRDTAVVS